MNSKPAVSVVIPAYNEATYIGRLLKALTKQSFKDFEVIVSDAKSKDGTEEAVESFKKTLDVKFIESPPRGPALGRNEGAVAARGEWLLFLDADVEIDDPGFIGTLLEQTKRRGWQTSSTAIKTRKASLTEKVGTALNYRYIRLLAHTKHPVAPGFCIFTHRDLFEKLGGFDRKLFFGEDYDYVSRSGFAGFGFVTATYYYLDLRRFRQGNQFKVFFNNVIAEIYRHTHHHRIDKPPFSYEFGRHKKRGD